MRYEYFIALKHMTHRKGNGFISLISFISIAGITVGVMALIVVLSVMSGFDRELKAKIVGANPHILVIQSGGLTDAAQTVQLIQNMDLPGIISIAPYVEGQAIVRSETNATGAVVKGISREDASIPGIAPYVTRGTLGALFEKSTGNSEDGDALPRIALGYQIAQLLNVRVGDTVDVISPALEERKKFLPKRARTQTFEVGAIFEMGMNSMDTALTLMALPEAQALFNLDGRSSGIAIRIKDVFEADRLKKIIQQGLGYPFWTESWIDVNKSFFSALKVEKHVMAILLFLIILVAGFNIVSTLIMVVMDKTKDVGILKALGATKRAILKIFLIQSGFVGCFGVVCGGTLGITMTMHLNQIADFLKANFGIEVFPSDIYYFNEIPTQINPDDIAIIIISALVISFLAGVYPAHRAASLNPVEALRYE